MLATTTTAMFVKDLEDLGPVLVRVRPSCSPNAAPGCARHRRSCLCRPERRPGRQSRRLAGRMGRRCMGGGASGSLGERGGRKPGDVPQGLRGPRAAGAPRCDPDRAGRRVGRAGCSPRRAVRPQGGVACAGLGRRGRGRSLPRICSRPRCGSSFACSAGAGRGPGCVTLLNKAEEPSARTRGLEVAEEMLMETQGEDGRGPIPEAVVVGSLRERDFTRISRAGCASEREGR